ncbi:hypothetical protein ACFLRX_08300 [Acidobacteriota bacterium]
MIRCKIINFLFRVFPVRAFQGFLIKTHFEGCQDCQNSLAKLEETRLFFTMKENTDEMINLWPGIRESLSEGSERKFRTPFVQKWKWALSAASLTVLIVTGFWYLNRVNSTEIAFRQDSDQSFQINYLKVREKPAGTYVYEPIDSEMIIVWAEILP